MSDLIHKVKSFGISGIWSFARNSLFAIQIKIRVRWNAILYPLKPSYGVTVVAEFGESNSLNKTMRDLVVRLARTGIPYQTLDITKGKRKNCDIDHLLTPRDEFRTRRYSVVLEMMKGVYPRIESLRLGRVVFWEAKDGVVRAFPFLTDGRLAIGMSDFNVDTFRREIGIDNTRKLLYPFEFASPTLDIKLEDVRKKYGIPKDAFMVFFNFDYTAYARKNPEAAVRAFAEAFSSCENTVIVFKTVRGEFFPERCQALHSVIEAVGLSNRFVEISDYVPSDDVYALTNSCDVYLSLHRGEGFGLGIAEAMSLGKPVVVSDYSSITEFCKKENACLVPCKMVKPTEKEREQIPYSWAVNEWADPDIHVAAKWLVELYRNKMLYAAIGMSAKNFMQTYFSDKEFKKSVFACFYNSSDTGDVKTVRK